MVFEITLNYFDEWDGYHDGPLAIVHADSEEDALKKAHKQWKPNPSPDRDWETRC